MPQAAVLKPCQYRHLFCVSRATSRDSECDTLVLLLGIYTGVRVSEIAQISVGVCRRQKKFSGVLRATANRITQYINRLDALKEKT